MIKEILLATPIIFTPANALKAAVTPVTTNRNGSIALNTSLKYTDYNEYQETYRSGNYMLPTTQEYNTGGVKISQKTYITQITNNLQLQPAGYPEPVYAITDAINITYIAKLELITGTADAINLNTSVLWPNIPEVLNTNNWTYNTYMFTNEDIGQADEDDITAALLAQENNFQQIYDNASTLRALIESTGTEDDYITNTSYAKMQQCTKGGIVDGNTYKGLNWYISEVENQRPVYIAYTITYLNAVANNEDPRDTTNQLAFTNMPRLLKYNYTATYTPTEAGTIDITGTIFEIVAMPFAFISQAFNFTLFAGTAYAINVSRIFLTIMVLGIVLYIIRRYVS